MNSKIEVALEDDEIVSDLKRELKKVEEEHGTVNKSTIVAYTQNNFWRELEDPYSPAVKVVRQVFSLDEFKKIMWEVHRGDM